MMAIYGGDKGSVNPDINELEPNATGIYLSKPIGKFKLEAGDIPKTGSGQALGAVLTDVGNIIEGGLKGAVTTTERFATDELHTSLDPVTERYTQHLKNVKEALYQNPQVQTDAPQLPSSNQGQSSVPSTVQNAGLLGDAANSYMNQQAGQTVPAGIQRSVGRVGDIEEIRKSGKFSETQYLAELNKELSTVRSHYGFGFRDFIDQKAHEITGFPVAKALIGSLLGDINAAVTASKTEKEKIANEALSATKLDPSLVPMYMKWRAGGVSDQQMLQEAANAHYKYHSIDRDLKVLQFEQHTRNDQEKKAESIGTRQLAQMGTDAFDNFIKAEGFKSRSDMENAVRTNPEQAQQIAEHLTASMPFFEQSMIDKLKMPLPPSEHYPPGSSIWSLMGATKARALINDELAVRKAWAEGLTNEKSGMAYHWVNFAKQTRAAVDAGLLSKPDIAEQAGAWKFLEQTIGSQALGALTQQQESLSEFAGKVNAAVKGLLKDRDVRIPTGRPDPGTGEKPSLKDDLGRVQATGNQSAEATDAFVSKVMLVKNESIHPSVRAEYVEYAFSPKNYQLIAQLQEEGKLPTFDKMTNDEMTRAVHKLGGNAWKMYKDWAQSTASNDLILPFVQKLNTVAAEPAMKVTYHSGEGKQSPEFHIDMGEIKNADTLPGNVPFKEDIKYINSVIANLGHIAHAEGRDVNQYIYGIFQHLGLDPRVGRLQGVPAMMEQAVRSSRAKPALIEPGMPTP